MKKLFIFLISTSVLVGCFSNGKPSEDIAITETNMFIRSFNNLQDECDSQIQKALRIEDVHMTNTTNLIVSNREKGRGELDSAYWYLGYAAAYRDVWKSINDKATHIRDSIIKL
jgi:hypothetical protein